MFGQGFKARIRGLHEEEDWQRDALVDEELSKIPLPHTKEMVDRVFNKIPVRLLLIADVVIVNGEGKRVGSFEIDVTDRRNTVFVGLEVPISWQLSE